MIKNFNFLFVTMFGLGKIKIIPGTLGSLVTTLFLFFLFHVYNVSSYLILFLFIIIFIYSFFAISKYIKESSNKDPGEIIIDEFLGQTIPIYFYEISHGYKKEFNDALLYYFIIFILFRFFDIVKPFPVNFFDEKFKNSFGVIMDDICAGFYVVLSLISFILFKKYISQ